jgi:pimeloyl-ACP methyl ester carboxylesterase
MAETKAESSPREVTYTSRDGLALFARDHGDRLSPWLPVVCLPGLTRTGRDFDALAVHLSTHRHRPRRVVAFDYRGRGRSAWDKRRSGYNPATETDDILDGMAALGVAHAVIVGTSRGGIIGMIMASLRPAVVAGLVLNDVGPALEARGLARIKAYVGATPLPDNWKDAAQIQKKLHGRAFPGWTDADWDYYARLTYGESDGQPVSEYDPALSETLAGIDFDRPIPALWGEFRTLKDIPMLAIRGANSDLLSDETMAKMAAEHPGLETVVVADEGHPPLLRDGHLLARISSFITGIEGSAPPAGAIVPRPPPEKRAADHDAD